MPKIKISGIELFYEVYGKNNTQGTIVFFNGVMATASSWQSQVDIFVQHGFKVLVHDLRGQLKSDKPQGPYSFKQHAHDSMALMKALGIEKAHLIGTSYGGEVVLTFTLQYPEMVQSIAVINSVSEVDEALKDGVNEWKRLAQTYDGETFFRGMLKSVYHPVYLKDNADLLEKRAKQFAAIPKDYFDGQIALYDTFMNDLNVTSQLHQIEVPVLIVTGENDELKPRHFSDLMAKEIKHAQYVIIPECGHVTIFEKPQTLNPMLLGFVLSQK
jgi:3-oxoadipate enol-lactonase